MLTTRHASRADVSIVFRVGTIRELSMQKKFGDSDMGPDGLDPDWCVEFVNDLVHEEGTVVFTNDWDSGGLGIGAGREEVYKYRGLYWPSSSTFGLSEPESNLKDALNGDVGAITSATTEIACTELSATALVKLLWVQQAPERTIRINGDEWKVSKEGKLTKV